ncbi:GAF and ANTAR domain-containing protein [Pseudarthrobacter cellobiosi]|uniref:GAF and ANTAR domain-containing protein n=1 Tax=Pseudarthrobacter cellobiosi TaxID=2953654 RepID=UPI00208EF3FD|nr:MULTISPECIES: ANTAR domain-containing protein [unclassified Pseudarthrobacter]MCO4255076.1 GAF and ANTAR domain-containing protein [Pseudarthrobacter sp. HLT1-5]MCO4275218.1 GAF and ANTAR domain-containing protein [Pseudarthrobacter sp. HLT3-5]
MAENDALPTVEQLQDLLLESPGFTEFLLGLTAISTSLLGGETPLLCAITVERETGPATVASSTETARNLDERQYALDDGPCLTALREQRTVLIRDLQADESWAWYAGAVADEGIRTILAVPTDNGSRSALNCYSTQLNTFAPDTVTAIEEHAASLSRILRLAIRVHASDPYPEHLRSALRSRAVVDSGVALIMVQNRCSHETAVKLLHLASRSSNRRLHDIAEDILRHASDIPVVTGGGEK